MTPRERILALAKRLEKDAEKHHKVGIACLERANDDLFVAKALQDLLPTMSDAQCLAAVKDWDDESKAN